MVKKALLAIIHVYRNYLSPLKLQTCRFYPTCSGYTEECLTKFNLIKALFKSAKRILKCHPLNRGGYDPVE